MERKEEIGYLIHKIDNRIKTRIDNQLKKNELTFSQSQVLHHLDRNGGSLNQKELQSLMNVSHPTIVGLVQRLETNGFVKTETDPQDRRNKIVTTTEAAEQFKKELIKNRTKSNKMMLEGISAEDMETAVRVLNRMLENINEMEVEGYAKNTGR
ncbi:MAG: MarR family transcriptional regulator [Erysipelotrichaceae bacterium]|nr:MarR family transcriptional regulator [Erysipelotrichaceae bacterium]MBQ1299682.1 MarR family transcriptional regulator [Erysipelotrichaceae bacterium]MBQ1303443.1 MarR family transcriptional regulator [Erysipelotrichaceae bacterium]